VLGNVVEGVRNTPSPAYPVQESQVNCRYPLSLFVSCLLNTQDADGSCSFGIKPSKEKEYHRGVMTTTVDDCQFVCIAQDNYYDILSAVSVYYVL